MEQVMETTEVQEGYQPNKDSVMPPLPSPVLSETKPFLITDLLPDEIVRDEDGKTYPLLHGLRRLAKPLIQREKHTVTTIVVPKQQVDKQEDGSFYLVKTLYLPLTTTIYEVTLKDGTVFSDVADAWYLNCKELGHHSAAVSASRAEARTLRKVLGIKEYAYEEMSPQTSDELGADSEIEPVQLKLIERKLQDLKLSVADALKLITAREIVTLKELTTVEATELIRILNDYSKREKKSKDKEKDKDN